MSQLKEILAYNDSFVQKGEYEEFRTTKFPDKRMVILTCMDTRLVELLPKAMNLKNGDAKIIKSAGAIVSHPFGSIMRSILVAIYTLNAEEVYIVGHHDCGMTNLSADEILEKAAHRGISESTFKIISNSGINLNRFLTGFPSVTDAVSESVKLVRNHPLLPADVKVHGLVINPLTGKLRIVSSEEQMHNESEASPPIPSQHTTYMI